MPKPKSRPSKATTKAPTPISSIKFEKEKRVNIPTEELRDFVTEEEKAPKTVLYPRDPSLDPQLVWRGKDEQDQKPLEVLTVPIYIQEKIHPQAIVENLRETAKAGELEPELALFNDFNGIKFEDQIEFYKHEQHWQNRMILGDSLLVMNSLAEKENLKGKVQMIYLDPPYGIKFGSNWQVKTDRRDVRDGRLEDKTVQPEQVKAFRDTWELGIHSYLSYLRDRLTAARELLTQSGSIFVQIGDDNLHLIRSVLDEVFGSENFINLITFQKTGGFSPTYLAGISDYIVWYGKNKSSTKYRQLYHLTPFPPIEEPNYVFLELPDGTTRRMTKEEKNRTAPFPTDSVIFRYGPLFSSGVSQDPYSFEFQGNPFAAKGNNHWKVKKVGLERVNRSDRLITAGASLSHKLYWNYFPAEDLNNVWLDTQSGGFLDPQVYVVQTTPKVIQRCMLMTTDPGDIVLDPTCGSGTTAYVAEQWGRRWITIDTSRVALALARTRLMAAKFPYYILRDEANRTKADISRGFVYKTVPHITLKSIANNEEIDIIWDKYQSQMEPLRAEYNKLTKQSLPEWEMPRVEEPPSDSPLQKGGETLRKWWELRRQRQKEIDGSIARRADTEYLYDQPEEDKKRIRVTGPFTVESLSPHRVLEAEPSPIGGAPEVDDRRDGVPATGGRPSQQDSDFTTIIIDNLRKAGVQNTRRNERLNFTRIEPAAGPYIHAKGYYDDADGKERMVAIAIGPEHGTVSPDLIEGAATEAVKARPRYDALYVLGFAFDATVDLERQKFGNLKINLTHMNPDLAMGDELLKKTGAGNLFMVFGEPDIALEKTKKGLWTVTINGVDIYDPTTGDVRSDDTKDIACWFIDTNYNEKSFFVRHAYFLGEKDPYERLKRALKGEIDEGTWSTLYSNTSRPFDPPDTGKIAVKVINMYGDEVMKVYECK